MQSTTSRYLILAAMLSLGALAFSVVARSVTQGPVRWPTEEQFVSAEGRSSQPGSTERINDTQFVTREYAKGGTAASLVIKTGTAAKGIYRSGPDVPFLGTGFSITRAPAEFVPRLNGG